MIAAKTQVTLDVVGATGAWVPRTVDTVRSQVISELSNSMTVNSLNVTKVSGGLFSQYPLVFGYQSTIVVTTKYGHASVNDINAIVRSAFWAAAGEAPTVSARGFVGQVVQQPGTGDDTPSPFPALLGVGSFTIIAAVAVAIFVLKRG